MRHVEKAVAVKKLLFERDRELYAYYWVMAGLTDQFVAEHFDTVDEMVRRRLASDGFIHQTPERFITWVRALRRNWLTEDEFAVFHRPP